MKSKIFYTANDATFVDKINKVIHLKDKMVMCKKPLFTPHQVFNSYLDRLSYDLSDKLILCPVCFNGLSAHNFSKIDNFDFDKYLEISEKNSLKSQDNED